MPRGSAGRSCTWGSTSTGSGSDHDGGTRCCEPAHRDGDTWSFVDLELDLYRDARGEAGIVDQDEFDALAAARLVAERDLAAARAAADQLLPLVRRRTEPFAEAAWPWLRRVREN